MTAKLELDIFAKRLVAIGAGLLSLALSVVFLHDYWNTRPEPSWPVVEATVTDRRMVATSLGGKRPRLALYIQPSGPTTYAVLSMNASGDIPNTAHFRFSGDTSKEVVLEEETSPLVAGLLFFFLPLALSAAWPSYERYLRKKKV